MKKKIMTKYFKMFFLDFIIIISLLSRINCEGSNLRSSPVFIIDYDHVHSCSSELTSNPLSALGESFFQSIVFKSKEKASVVVMFVEEHLVTEDLSGKDHLGTPYHYLQRSLAENNAYYFPAVVNPFKVLSEMLPSQLFNVLRLRNTNTNLQGYAGLKYLYVYFEDGKNETRSIALRRHDLIMRQVYFILRQLVPGPVVAIYTGKTSPAFTYGLRSSPSKSDTKKKHIALKFNSDTVRYKFGELHVIRKGMPKKRVTFLPQLTESYTVKNKELINRLVYDNFVLEFNYSITKSNWHLDTINLHDRSYKVVTTVTKLRTDSGRWFLTEMKESREFTGSLRTNIGASWGTYYVCGRPLAIHGIGNVKTIIISDYQIEPVREGTVHSLRAQSCKHKHAFVTAPICAGFMVVFLMLVTLFYGVVSLYNVKANDRYDDPTAKELIIATEG